MSRGRRRTTQNITPPTPKIRKVGFSSPSKDIPKERSLIVADQSDLKAFLENSKKNETVSETFVIVNGERIKITEGRLIGTDGKEIISSNKKEVQITPELSGIVHNPVTDETIDVNVVKEIKTEEPPIEETGPPEKIWPDSPRAVDTVPGMFSVHLLTGDEGYTSVPDSPNIFYVAAKEGLYEHRKMLIGQSFLPVKELPKKIGGVKSVGEYPGGIFWFQAPIVPSEICASVVAFFRRIYDYQKTEAEVLLLMNYQTKEWKVWVPTQNVSHGGVHSVYEPADIPKDFIVVGTMHSHCNFGAYHSGTDTTDASGFDGLHITIGHLLDKNPEVAAMVMINKAQFDYKDISYVADFSNLAAAEAPEEWDKYVEDTKEKLKPVGHELFIKYPRYQTHYQNGFRPAYTPPAGNWSPNNYASQIIHSELCRCYSCIREKNQPTKQTPTQHQTRPPLNYQPTNYQPRQHPLPSNADLDPVERGMWDTYFRSDEYRQKDKGGDKEHDVVPSFFRNNDDDDDLTHSIDDKDLALEILEALDDNLAIALMNSSILLDDDLDISIPEALDPVYWKRMYLRKLQDAANVLRALGQNVKISFDTKS